MIKIKRVYEPVSPSDGKRILVDRLWPRGVSKAKAKVDYWAKEVAPTTELREWFGHDPAKWSEFKRKYLAELQQNPAVADLKEELTGHCTLVYGAKDTQHNQGVVLQEFLAS